MIYIEEITYWFTVLVFLLLAMQSCYLLLFSLAGRIFKAEKYVENNNLKSFVIYIPSYKEDSVIIDTALAAVQLKYPPNKKAIVVIADSLKPDTLAALSALPIRVVEVSFEKSTKAKALNMALQKTQCNYDFALILDADNICDPYFLFEMNNALQGGYSVVQGQRVAKNTNTDMALLDAISEGINNHIFRKGHRALGFSCAIIGSGMALKFSLFKEIMPEITAVGGFDKEMELRLLKRGICFGYAEDAIVYDEKTQHGRTFENQRRRWMSAQINYMRLYLADGFKQLLKGNFDFFDKVMQTLLLPRILILGIMPIAFFVSLIPGPFLETIYWLGLWVISYMAILIAIPSEYLNRRLLNTLLTLPAAFFMMIKLLFKLKGANKKFIHTPHGDIM